MVRKSRGLVRRPSKVVVGRRSLGSMRHPLRVVVGRRSCGSVRRPSRVAVCRRNCGLVQHPSRIVVGRRSRIGIRYFAIAFFLSLVLAKINPWEVFSDGLREN